MSQQVGVVGALAESPGGLTVPQLVGLLGKSDSQVRRELSALVAMGAVATLKDDPIGPGRPALRFRFAPPTSGWPEIVRMLLATLGRHDWVDQDVLLQIARERGAEMATGEFPHGVVDVMARLGFAPRDCYGSLTRIAGILQDISPPAGDRGSGG